MDRPRARTALVFRFRAYEFPNPKLLSEPKWKLDKLFARRIDFSYKLTKPALPVFGGCGVYTIWRLFAPDEAGEITGSLGRDLGA